MSSPQGTQQVRDAGRKGWRTRWVIGAVAVLGLVSVAVVAVVFAVSKVRDQGDSVELIYPNSSGAWGDVTLPYGKRGNPVAFTGATKVCVSKPGSVVIHSVRGYGGDGGLVVTRVAAKPVPARGEEPGNGAADGPLETIGFDTSPPIQVTTPCAPDAQTLEQHPERHLSDIGLEYKRVTASTGSLEGFILTYSDGQSKKRELKVRFGMRLCAPGDKTTPDCAALEQQR